MAKDPAFLFYPGDWLGGTLGMSFEEKGAYMELLMMQFTRGHMTKDMIGQTVGHLWVKLQDKFTQDAAGLWYNERLDLEKERRKNFVTSRKNNKEGNNQHTKDKKDGGHMSSHMVNVNKDVIINTVNNKEEIEKSIFEDEKFMKDLERTHKGKDLKDAWNQCWLHFSQLPSPLHDWQWRQKFSSWLTNYTPTKKIKKGGFVS
jgi:uncharacterized protein YdaU (DUF1376 family)